MSRYIPASPSSPESINQSISDLRIAMGSSFSWFGGERVAFCNRHWRAAHWLVLVFCAEAPRTIFGITIHLSRTPTSKTPINPQSPIYNFLKSPTLTSLTLPGGTYNNYFWGYLLTRVSFCHYRHVMREKYVTSFLHVPELERGLTPPLFPATALGRLVDGILYTYTHTQIHG